MALPNFPSADCDAANGILSEGGGAVPGDSDADTFGDDPYFDDLWTDCDDGDMVACDDLYYASPVDSDYEDFGATCGDRITTEIDCVEGFDS
ncbi:MAG: hypothetical protein M5U31_16275 [Acidimicrobiia bacterium]|nr:hypothetical protein [Acidimicrobiia bacterium]